MRSAHDCILQNILQLLIKTDPLEEYNIKFIITNMLNKCTFVTSQDNLPDNIVKIVLRREARDQLIKNYIIKTKNNTLITKNIIKYYDEY